jgi:hypothetical protein
MTPGFTRRRPAPWECRRRAGGVFGHRVGRRADLRQQPGRRRDADEVPTAARSPVRLQQRRRLGCDVLFLARRVFRTTDRRCRMTAATSCRTYGTELRLNAKFCDECGAPTASATPRAEYKQVTVLFADVVHSMDIAAASRRHGNRLAAAPADGGLAAREIMLLRLRALLARARGDEVAYRDLVDRYRTMAAALGFEGHLAWTQAMS